METVETLELHCCPECGSAYVEFVTARLIECGDCGIVFDVFGEFALLD